MLGIRVKKTMPNMKNDKVWANLIFIVFWRISFCADKKIYNGSMSEKAQEKVMVIKDSQPCPPLQQTREIVIIHPPLIQSGTLNPVTYQPDIVTKELIFTSPFQKGPDLLSFEKDCMSNIKSQILQSQNSALPNSNSHNDLKDIAQQGHSALIIEDKAQNVITLEKVDYIETKSDELNIFFKELNYEPISVAEFYDYFDVLGYIDKSIVYIQQFLETLSGSNMTKILETRQKIFEKIYEQKKKNLELSKTVEELYKRKKEEKQNSTKYDFIEDGLQSIKDHKEFLDDQLRSYVKFQYQDYQKAITMKIQKLISLQDYLKKVRAKICPLCKEEIEKHADLFKTTFKNTVSEVYTSLTECHEKEKNILTFFFENLNENLKNTKRCDEELKLFKNILKDIDDFKLTE